MSRVWVLATYLMRELFRSLSGWLIAVLAGVFYLAAIQSVVGGIDRDYYAVVIGGFFALQSLLLTVILADRAFHARSYLLLFRVPSRPLFLAAIVLAALVASSALLLLVGVASLTRLTTPLPPAAFLDIVPVWVSWMVLGAMLGLHLCELVRRGWSRAVTYGLLAFVLFSLNQQETGAPTGFADRFSWIPHLSIDPERWKWAVQIANVILWPIAQSIAVARSAEYNTLQSLSPAMLLLLSALLFGLASLLFARKDLILPEG